MRKMIYLPIIVIAIAIFITGITFEQEGIYNFIDESMNKKLVTCDDKIKEISFWLNISIKNMKQRDCPEIDWLYNQIKRGRDEENEM